MAENSKQNLTTVIAVIVALIAVVYALMVCMNKPTLPQGNGDAFAVGENNPVVMTINGQGVTRSAILDNFNRSGSRVPEGAPMEKLFPMMQEQYLVGELITQAARKSGVDVTNQDVVTKAKPALEQAIRAVYLEQLGDKGVSDKDVERAYDDLVVNAPEMKERRASHILIKDEKKANAILIKAQKASDFAKLAKENSEGPSAPNGGDLGYFVPDEMVPEFSKAAFGMKIGAVSDKTVKTQFGYHIIKVLEERVRTKPELGDVKDQIKQQLAQGVVSKKMQEMREAAKVEIFDVQGQPLKKAEVEAEIKEEEKSEK
jgi:peptidyl-prolyl cis-trans isomerase C